MISQNDVTIIIPHLGKNDDMKRALNECLKSLDETVPDIKKIVAMNTFYELDSLPKNTTKILFPNESHGQCIKVNAAVATTNTKWVFITNDDMIYSPGWFEQLTKHYEGTRDTNLDDQNILCISPLLIEPRPGAPTFETHFFGGAGGDFSKEGWLLFAKYRMESYCNILRTGFNLPLLIRRDLWDTVGGYDINYDPWGSNSDSDLEYKIKLAGIQPYQNTNCIVYHFSQTSGTFNPANDSYRFRNYAYFKEKWGFDRTDDGIWTADFKMPTKKEGRIFCPDYEGKYGKVY